MICRRNAVEVGHFGTQSGGLGIVGDVRDPVKFGHDLACLLECDISAAEELAWGLYSWRSIGGEPMEMAEGWKLHRQLG
jgi:hypothetical protein